MPDVPGRQDKEAHRMLGQDVPPNDKTEAELWAAVSVTFTESLMSLAKLIVANDTDNAIKDGARKAYDAVWKRMVLEMDPAMRELHGQTRH
jgi:methionine-rich copper-binding protein CopC